MIHRRPLPLRQTPTSLAGITSLSIVYALLRTGHRLCYCVRSHVLCISRIFVYLFVMSYPFTMIYRTVAKSNASVTGRHLMKIPWSISCCALLGDMRKSLGPRPRSRLFRTVRPIATDPEERTLARAFSIVQYHCQIETRRYLKLLVSTGFGRSQRSPFAKRLR